MSGRWPRIWVKRNVSQVARTSSAVRGKSLIRERIELTGEDIPFDCGIELFCVERLEPRTKPRQLGWSELFDGLFKVFGGCHVESIASPGDVQKGDRAPPDGTPRTC